MGAGWTKTLLSWFSSKPDPTGVDTVNFKLSQRSRDRLVGVHPDLVRVVELAILLTTVDFSVVDGVRTLNKQREYFNRGKSKTMNSRHLTGHAVDLAPWVHGEIDWSDGPHWLAISDAMKQAAYSERIPLTWGGEWEWQDKPHFELPWSTYNG